MVILARDGDFDLVFLELAGGQEVSKCNLVIRRTGVSFVCQKSWYHMLKYRTDEPNETGSGRDRRAADFRGYLIILDPALVMETRNKGIGTAP